MQGFEDLGLALAFLQEANNLFASVIGAEGVSCGGIEQKPVFGNGNILADFHEFLWILSGY
ncbi:MAG: hypothetical protein ACKODJ_02915 [Bacteroidota bacterium]